MPRREALLPAAAAAHAGLLSGGDLPMGIGNADLDDQYASIYVFIYVFIYVSVGFSITYTYIIYILYTILYIYYTYIIHYM